MTLRELLRERGYGPDEVLDTEIGHLAYRDSDRSPFGPIAHPAISAHKSQLGVDVSIFLKDWS